MTFPEGDLEAAKALGALAQLPFGDLCRNAVEQGFGEEFRRGVAAREVGQVVQVPVVEGRQNVLRA